MTTRQLTMRLEVPTYDQYSTDVGGYLSDHRASRALFHYYVTARAAYERIEDPIKVEQVGQYGHVIGEGTKHNFHQLFASVALIYNVEPEEMTKYWMEVDMQAGALGLPLLPDAEWLRFNKVPEIQTNGEDNA